MLWIAMRCDKFKHGRENGQPEDGEDDGQPDGDGVHDDTEAGEKHHEAHSRQTVARRVVRCRLLLHTWRGLSICLSVCLRVVL